MLFGFCARAYPAELAPVAPVLDCAQLKNADFSGVPETPIHITSAVAIDQWPPGAAASAATSTIPSFESIRGGQALASPGSALPVPPKAAWYTAHTGIPE
jgi:hypothetical protein